MGRVLGAFLLFVPLSLLAQQEKPVAVTVEAPAEVQRGTEFRAVVRFVMKEGIHIYAPDAPKGTPTVIEAVPLEGVKFSAPEFPKPVRRNYPKIGGEFDLYEGTLDVPVTVTVEPNSPVGEAVLSFKITYGACTEDFCYMPQRSKIFSARFTIAAPPGPKPPKDRIRPPMLPPDDPSPIENVPPSPADEDGPLAGYLKQGLLVALVAVFVGGMLTSLTPCVFPMIPITVTYFQMQSGGSRGKRLRMALVYVVGIAMTFSALGLLASLAGSSVNIQGNIYVMIPFVACFTVLGLSMFGLYEIRLPHQLISRIGGGRSGYLGAFIMGLVLGLIAAPCVGPVLAGILLFISRTQDPLLGFSLLFTYALGIGVLFVVLAVFSVSLPRSGRWMVLVKEIFGVLLFAAALYFLQAFVSMEVLALLIGLLIITWGLLVWVRWKVLGGLRYPAKMAPILFFGLCTLAGSAFVVSPFVKTAEGHTLAQELIERIRGKSLVKWTQWYDGALEQARREGKPVLIDFWAVWCPPCLGMDRTTFSDPAVLEALKRFVPIKVDVTRSGGDHPAMKSHRLANPPALVFYDSRGNHVRTVNSALDPAELLEVLKKIP